MTEWIDLKPLYEDHIATCSHDWRQDDEYLKELGPGIQYRRFHYFIIDNLHLRHYQAISGDGWRDELPIGPVRMKA